MNKTQKLLEIAQEIEDCEICKRDSIGKAVPGEGNPNAKIALIGEAPGRKESETGRPFVGRSGQLLRSTLEEIGIKPEETFITSPVKYLPKRPARNVLQRNAGGGTPSKQQIAHGKVHFDKQMEIINPEIIVLMGKVAVWGVLGIEIPVLKRHGEIIEVPSAGSLRSDSGQTGQARKYLITIHPAAVIRFKKYREIFIKDLLKLKNL